MNNKIQNVKANKSLSHLKYIQFYDKFLNVNYANYIIKYYILCDTVISIN